MNDGNFHLLFLVLRVFGNEKREALVDATLLEELLKLLLEVKIEGFELKIQEDKCNVRRVFPRSNKEKVGIAPEGRYRVRGVSNQLRG